MCTYMHVCAYVCAYVFTCMYMYMCPWCSHGGARGVMAIVVGNGHGDMSSKPGRD